MFNERVSRTVTRSPKIFLLLAASFSLAACETAHTVTKPLDAAPPVIEAASEAPPAIAREPVIVRSAVVPDDPVEAPAPAPEPVVHPVHKPKPKPVIVTASVAGPDLADEPAAPVSAPVHPVKPTIVVKPAPVVKHADAAEPPPAVVTPPVTPPPAATPPTSITPPPVAAPPAAEPPPPSALNVSPGWLPKTWPKEPRKLLQVPIAGMPLWLVVLFVLLAFISLVIGFRGKKAAEPVST